MNTLSPRRSERRASTSSNRLSRRGLRPREAWITDPDALLSAIAAAANPPPPAPIPAAPISEVLPVMDLEPGLPVAPATPVLREDERIGRRSDAGVVVIIRRRRAA